VYLITPIIPLPRDAKKANLTISWRGEW